MIYVVISVIITAMAMTVLYAIARELIWKFFVLRKNPDANYLNYRLDYFFYSSLGYILLISITIALGIAKVIPSQSFMELLSALVLFGFYRVVRNK